LRRFAAIPSPAQRRTRRHRTVNADSFCRNTSHALRCTLPLAALALLPIATAMAADERRSSLPDASAPFGPVGWLIVVVLGLLAVAAGALTMGRPGRPPTGRSAANDSTLGITRAGPVADGVPAGGDADRRDDIAAHATASATTHAARTTARAPGTPPAPAPASRVAATARGTSAARPARAPAAETAAGPHAFLALHHVDLSIDVLHRHVDAEARPMPAVWVMLLDLCRTHGREQKFRELALEFHHRFNVRQPNWERYPPGRDEPGLEAYPRLVKAITATWGTHECRRLVDRLLYDNRGGSRRGFTLNAYNDLIALRRAAHSVLETIETDLALEARQPAPGRDVPANDATAGPSPLLRELQDQLEDDLVPAAASASALEREQPAFVGVLAREWGNAALAGRLCEMLARGGDGAAPLSADAQEELELLQRMAERLDRPARRAAAAGD
jgi:hypothetical protein